MRTRGSTLNASSTTATVNPATSASPSASSKSGISRGTKAGAGVAVPVGVLAILAAIFVLDKGAGKRDSIELGTSNGLSSSLLLTMSIEKRDVLVRTWLLRRRG